MQSNKKDGRTTHGKFHYNGETEWQPVLGESQYIASRLFIFYPQLNLELTFYVLLIKVLNTKRRLALALSIVTSSKLDSVEGRDGKKRYRHLKTVLSKRSIDGDGAMSYNTVGTI